MTAPLIRISGPAPHRPRITRLSVELLDDPGMVVVSIDELLCAIAYLHASYAGGRADLMETPRLERLDPRHLKAASEARGLWLADTGQPADRRGTINPNLLWLGEVVRRATWLSGQPLIQKWVNDDLMSDFDRRLRGRMLILDTSWPKRTVDICLHNGPVHNGCRWHALNVAGLQPEAAAGRLADLLRIQAKAA